jgi:hypothetical protein
MVRRHAVGGNPDLRHPTLRNCELTRSNLPDTVLNNKVTIMNRAGSDRSVCEQGARLQDWQLYVIVLALSAAATAAVFLWFY